MPLYIYPQENMSDFCGVETYMSFLVYVSDSALPL